VIWFLTGYFLYGAAAVCAVGMAYKIIALWRMPRHLRWDLYPIPRQAAEGSKYEQVDFAQLPNVANHWSEWDFMLREILLFKKVWAGRRDLWPGTFLLHAGLYGGIVLVGLLAAEAIVEICLDPLLASVVLTLAFLHRTLAFVAPAVCGAGFLGAIYLAGLRLADRGLRDLSDPVTFFNLALLAALFAAGLWATVAADPGLVEARSHLVSLFRGRPGVVAAPSLAAAMVLAGLFAAYLPFSRMFHFGAKYFFYHEVLWDDELMRADSRLEKEMDARLEARLTWSAAHLRQNQSWREQLSPADGTKGQSHGQ
jgi:nitrate reductase gamma subunit